MFAGTGDKIISVAVLGDGPEEPASLCLFSSKPRYFVTQREECRAFERGPPSYSGYTFDCLVKLAICTEV